MPYITHKIGSPVKGTADLVSDLIMKSVFVFFSDKMQITALSYVF